MNQRFTVIILLYNNDRFLKECLDSVLSQDYPDIEVIIADDYSKEFNKEKIEHLFREKPSSHLTNHIVYQNGHNLGTVKNANHAIQKASGRYIKLLGADDALYDNNVLSKAALALKESPNGIISCDVMNCDKELNEIGRYRNPLRKKINTCKQIYVFRRVCVHNEILAAGIFFSRQFFDTYGLFDESYYLLEDWPTWLTVIKKGCRIQYHPFWGIRYRSNCGIATGINQFYMSDKKRVLNTIVIPSKKEIGIFWYCLARISFFLVNSMFIRKLYGALFRKKSH